MWTGEIVGAMSLSQWKEAHSPGGVALGGTDRQHCALGRQLSAPQPGRR